MCNDHKWKHTKFGLVFTLFYHSHGAFIAKKCEIVVPKV